MAVKQLWTTPPQFVDSSGNPYSGAYLFFYAAGSSTKQNTFTDDTGNTACPNPITLNSSGYPAVSGTILAPWGTVGQTYKIGLAAPGSSDPPSSFIWSQDDVAPINDTTVTIDQWVSGPAPTYVSATSFTLVGDQTSTFQVGRRLKTTNSGGTVYSTIITSAYGALTTVTVVNDSGTLDSGLSAVSYGLLTPTNPSTPVALDTYPIASGSSDRTKKVRLEVDGLTTSTTRVLTVPDNDGTILTSGNPNVVTLGTTTTGTGATSYDYTGLPSDCKQITISFNGTSLSGTANLLIQIGDSGGVETSGYSSASGQILAGPNLSTNTSSAGFILTLANAGIVLRGSVTLTLLDTSNFMWAISGGLMDTGSPRLIVCGGAKSLSAVLDRVRITTDNGTDTFDSTTFNIAYLR